MRCKSIILFLFLVTVFCASAKRIYQNETLFARTASRENRSAVTTFVLLNPRQIRRAETTIGRFLARLAGPAVRPITLRLSSRDGDSLQRTIREICGSIRAKIAELAHACGLTSVRQCAEMSRDSTLGMSEDWFSEGLVQGSLLLRDLVRIGGEVWAAIDRYFDTHNVTLQENRELSPRRATSSFEFLSAINDAARFNERLFKCSLSLGYRRERASSFDLNRALANLARSPPDRAVKRLKTSLDRAFFRYAPSNDTSGERLYVPLCHSLVERAGHHGDCVEELRRLETCVLSARDETRDTIADRAFPIESWLTAIENLSGCRIRVRMDGNASIRCNHDRTAPRTTARQVKYIYEGILDRRISRRSPLHHAASVLGNALSTSRWGRRFAYDVYQYCAIYQEGRRRLNVLSRNAARNKKAATRYKKMSESLNLYKSGVLRKTLLAIGNVHRSVLETQKFLIYGIRIFFKGSWRNYINILACISDWMKKLLELFGCTSLNETDVDVPNLTDIPPINMTDSASAMMTSDDLYDRDNNEIKYIVTCRKKDRIRKKIDEAFERLLQSMNRISRMRNRNNRSSLACLANNLLLVAMFMESISFISTMFCLGEHKNKSNSEELKEE